MIGTYVVGSKEYSITNDKTLCRIVSPIGLHLTVEIVDTFDEGNIGTVGMIFTIEKKEASPITLEGWKLLKAVRRV